MTTVARQSRVRASLHPSCIPHTPPPAHRPRRYGSHYHRAVPKQPGPNATGPLPRPCSACLPGPHKPLPLAMSHLNFPSLSHCRISCPCSLLVITLDTETYWIVLHTMFPHVFQLELKDEGSRSRNSDACIYMRQKEKNRTERAVSGHLTIDISDERGTFRDAHI